MVPASRNITIRRGDTFRLFFRLKYVNVDSSVTYPDLTSWGSGLSQVRQGVDGSIVATMAVTKSNQTTYPGGILLSISAATTAALNPNPTNDLVWDFEITNHLGENDTYIEGAVTFVKDVSKP